MTTIDYYDPSRDEAGALACWNASSGDLWPTDAEILRLMVGAKGPHRAGPHFVARDGDQLTGFVLTQIMQVRDFLPEPPDGHVAMLCVAREHQRRGIGRDLLGTALDSLRAEGVRRVMLGGRVPRLFPGVPTNLPGALDFFRALGWPFNEPTYDLYRDITGYETPSGIHDKLEAEQITIRPATREDEADILAFEQREFKLWYDEIGYPMWVGDHDDIIVARDDRNGGQVVGALCIYARRRSHESRGDAPWHTIMGANCGGLNAVGVAASARGRGIGVGMCAVGTEVLKARGVGTVHIGWTHLADFYGKLGYQVWREFMPSWRTI